MCNVRSENVHQERGIDSTLLARAPQMGGSEEIGDAKRTVVWQERIVREARVACFDVRAHTQRYTRKRTKRENKVNAISP